jgi:NAD(P)-dependent dehydrogenase (short-subunit alcohol dehydrogenase family)
MAETVFRERILEGKVAFVTGGGSGINFGIARRLAQQGAKVALLGRTKEKLDAAVQELRTAGGTATAHPADVRNAEQVGAALAEARAQHGELDILVCGAAGNFPAAAVGMSPNGFKSVVDIDLLGTFNAARLAYEHLRKPGACILNISAGQAFTPTRFQAHVCAAKAGVDMLTRTLALEWGPDGIRVNSLTPGATAGTLGMDRLTPDDAARARLADVVPLRRFGTREEVADLALFLCSPAAAYITGAVLLCDGGLSLQGSGVLSRALLGG